MSPKRAGLKIIRLTPGGRYLRQTLLKLAKELPGLQVTSVDESGLRGVRDLFSPEELEEPAIELIPFGNVVSRVCRLARIQTLRLAQRGQVVAAIGEACNRLPVDSPLSFGARMGGVHRALEESLQELRGFGCTPTSLDLLANELSPALGEKLRSVAFLLRESDESLQLLGREHLHNWLSKSLGADPADCEELGPVVILLNSPLTPLMADWIWWLSKTPAKVVLIGEIHGELPELFASGPAYFSGAKTEWVVDGASASQRLFIAPSDKPATIQLHQFSAPDVLGECEWTLRRVAEDLKTGNRVGILVRDLGKYAPALVASSARLQVPIAMAYRAPLLSNRLVTFFLRLLQALTDSDVRALIQPLGSAYAGLSPETRAAAESVLREVSRAGVGGWEVLETIQEGLAGEIPWLIPLLEWRSEAIKRDYELHDWFDQILSFADLIPWQEAAMQWPEFAERDARAQTAMQRALTERASISKVHRLRPTSFSEAVRWIAETWESADYSVPAGETGARVVSKVCELGDCNSVYALGLLEGDFPKRPREDPIFGDLERDEISRAASFSTPLTTSRDKALSEREEFVRLVGAPSGKLTLSYHQTSDDRDSIPTAYLEEARQTLPGVQEQTHGRGQLVPKEPLLGADVQLAASLSGPRAALAESDFRSEATRQKFRWEEDRPFEPHQLRRAAMCGFQFFARDRLGLRPNRRSQLWNRLISLPAKANLATAETPELARTALLSQLHNLLDTYVGRLDRWELALVESGGKRLVDDWVFREFRARELWPREVTATDVPLGTGGLIDRVAKDIFLSGSAPATGQMGPYSLVRLYETSADEKINEDSTKGDFLYYMLWVGLAKNHQEGTAIEVETLRQTRHLYVYPRQGGAFRTDKGAGLVASVITNGDESRLAPAQQVREYWRATVDQARAGKVAPMPSPHCRSCYYGELCRRSAEFGETDDPFEVGNE